MVEVEITTRENDGAAWYKDNVIYINVRWLQLEEEAEWFIDESFMHEYIEHVLGLGHEKAIFIEMVLRDSLYRDWYGVNPLKLLYHPAPRESRASRAFSQLEHEALQLSL
ncbi:hypothetical protein CF15_06590 [Pyrodictium occultum]|uniref:Uncharacterized protein n=1 Tax=Pyrodictium occultum TaxID=2309 RepID=A0A0V8RWJ7_PYROC|nr:hypothetical protein [Pyrodictium occultum]KSW12392.1 hypothetical protein CF15_06590 [Pyrodictium occultum]